MSDFEKPFATTAPAPARAARKTTTTLRADQSPVASDVAPPTTNVFGACTLDSSGCEFQASPLDASASSDVIPGRRLW